MLDSVVSVLLLVGIAALARAVSRPVAGRRPMAVPTEAPRAPTVWTDPPSWERYEPPTYRRRGIVLDGAGR